MTNQEPLTAHPPLDEIAMYVFGAYLLDMDLLDGAKDKKKVEMLSEKTSMQRKIILFCQQWDGQGDGVAYLKGKLQAEGVETHKKMIAILQDALLVD